MNIVNLTPHAITIEKADGTRITIPPTAPAARVTQQNYIMADVDGIPVSAVVWGEVENVPAPADNTVYVVSAMVAQRLPERSDVLAPDTGASAIRESGNIVAVRGFVKY